MSAQISEPIVFRAMATFLDLRPNAGCISDVHVDAAAGIKATKLEHQHRANYAQESDTTAAAEDRVVHVVHGTTGTLKAFKAGSVVANLTGATVSVDLHKNGASILTAAIVLDDADAAYDVVAGVIDTAAVLQDDVLEVVVTVAAGGGTLGKGVFAMLDLHEDES